MTADRVDRAERLIKASSDDVYRAFIVAADLERWLPPAAMSGQVHELQAEVGRGYEMSLYYPEDSQDGKTTLGEDRFSVTFVELVPGERVVQRVRFIAHDPSFESDMRQEWSFVSVDGATSVSVECTDVPAVITPEAHEAGLSSSLENLAHVVEGR